MGAMQAFLGGKMGGTFFFIPPPPPPGEGKSFVTLGTEKRAARRDRYRTGLFLGGEEKIHSAGRKKKGDRYSYFAPGREEEFLRFPTFWKKEIPVPFFYFPICSPRPLSISYFPEFNRHSSHYMDSSRCMYV